MWTRAAVRSPVTEPSFLISMRSRARRLPLTLPNTTTSRATISAVTLALAPTVILPSLKLINPSALPSICKSSFPEISPFTCRLAPSRAPARSDKVVRGRTGSILVRVSFQDDGTGFDGLVPGGLETAGCVARTSLSPHMIPPWIVHTHQSRKFSLSTSLTSTSRTGGPIMIRRSSHKTAWSEGRFWDRGGTCLRGRASGP